MGKRRTAFSKAERSDDPVWEARGELLLAFLTPEHRTWEQLKAWEEEHGYKGMLRNIMAAVDDRVVYRDGRWYAAPAVPFEPVPRGPPCTLHARMASEML